MIYDALVEKQQEQTQNKLIASTSGDRFKQPQLQMLARSVSRAQLGTDRAKQRIKDEKVRCDNLHADSPNLPSLPGGKRDVARARSRRSGGRIDSVLYILLKLIYFKLVIRSVPGSLGSRVLTPWLQTRPESAKSKVNLEFNP